MARVLHGISIESLPEPGELKNDDQIVAYRNDTGKAYRADVDALATQGVDLLDKVYPVGSIYMSVNATDPANFIGGTWEQIHDRFLLAAGGYAAGEEGGTTSVALSSDNIPSHTHSLPSHTHSIPSLSGTAASAGSHSHHLEYYPNNLASGSARPEVNTGGTSTTSGSIPSAGAHTHSVTTNSSTTGSKSGTSGASGSGSAFDIMPPYLAVYMWQRIA